MIEEPYRWLEAVSNRREYVREQLKGGSPVFAASLEDGMLFLGVGTGKSKVFEVFDRHAITGLGHPADLEKIRQAAIDAAHLEAFNRAPDDVSLRRLVSFGLSLQLKTNFEQIFTAPFLVELVLGEVGASRQQDFIVRLHFDGRYQIANDGVAVAAATPEVEGSASEWLKANLAGKNRTQAAEVLLQAWWCILDSRSFGDTIPAEQERQEGWRRAVQGKTVEIGWLARASKKTARFELLTLSQVGL